MGRAVQTLRTSLLKLVSNQNSGRFSGQNSGHFSGQISGKGQDFFVNNGLP